MPLARREVRRLQEAERGLRHAVGGDLSVDLAAQLAALAERAATQEGCGLVLCVNKWDLIDKDSYSMNEYTKTLRSKLRVFEWASVTYVSALTGRRTQKVLEGSDPAGFVDGGGEQNGLVQGYALAFLAAHHQGDHTWHDRYVAGNGVPGAWTSPVLTRRSDRQEGGTSLPNEDTSTAQP